MFCFYPYHIGGSNIGLLLPIIKWELSMGICYASSVGGLTMDSCIEVLQVI